MERSGKPAAEQAQRFVSMAVHQIGGQLRRVKWPWDSNGARNSQNASASILRPASLQEDARGGRQEPRSGTSFPGKVNVRGSGCADLCGVGMRRKRIAGIKDINVYAVGMYFNSGELKKVASRKKESQEKVLEDVIDQKGMKNVIRLVLVYPRVTGKMITVSLDEQIGSKLRKVKPRIRRSGMKDITDPNISFTNLDGKPRGLCSICKRIRRKQDEERVSDHT